WPSVTNCIGATKFGVGKAKLAAIRLDPSGDSLMAYSPKGGTVRFYDGAGLASAPQMIGVDASPLLRDFNRDGCTDILWFSPHLPSSPLWTARCDGTKSFSVTLFPHPDSVYPLGFGLGHGRP